MQHEHAATVCRMEEMFFSVLSSNLDKVSYRHLHHTGIRNLWTADLCDIVNLSEVCSMNLQEALSPPPYRGSKAQWHCRGIPRRRMRQQLPHQIMGLNQIMRLT